MVAQRSDPREVRSQLSQSWQQEANLLQKEKTALVQITAKYFPFNPIYKTLKIKRVKGDIPEHYMQM